MIAGGDEAVEGEGVLVGGGEFFFEKAAKNAGGDGGELKFGEVFHLRNLNRKDAKARRLLLEFIERGSAEGRVFSQSFF